MLPWKPFHRKPVNLLKPDHYSSVLLVSGLGHGGRSLLTRENEKMMLLQRYLSLQDSSQILIMELNSKRSGRIMPLEITRKKLYIICILIDLGNREKNCQFFLICFQIENFPLRANLFCNQLNFHRRRAAAFPVCPRNCACSRGLGTHTLQRWAEPSP